MNFLKATVIFLFIGSWSWCTAQQSELYHHASKTYLEALDLYRAQHYQTAQQLFHNVELTSADQIIQSNSAFYRAQCAVRLELPVADRLMESFITKYPTSVKQNKAQLQVADYYFKKAKFARALKWYKKVNTSTLNNADLERYRFNFGYTNYSTKNFKVAKQLLLQVEHSENYGSQAKYYLGYMAYSSDDYTGASQYFDQVSNLDYYKTELGYYQADLNFKLGNFEKAIEIAKHELDADSKANTSELSKIIGESFFNLKNYKEAIPFLLGYKGKQGKWSNTDYYQLGFAYYKQGDYEGALLEFNKIIGGNNAIAQNAYYHLAECYIRLDKKAEALNAFKTASEMDYNSKIKQDSWFNYAKLSYDIGNPYQPTSEILSSFVKLYPKSPFLEIIETLLIDSYISSKNYENALNLLSKNKRPENRIIDQKVSFFRALELYNANKNDQALTLIDRSIAIGLDPYFTTRALYWQAELNFLKSNFNQAALGYLQVKNSVSSVDIPEYKNLCYNLGYAFFKQKKYDKAISAFEAFVIQNKIKTILKNDAYLRIGDSYFITTNYTKAIASYSKAQQLAYIETDYATLQKALCFGYLGQTANKIQTLKSVLDFNRSSFKDEALFELGNTYVNSNQADKALTYYKELLSSQKSSPLVSKTLLRQGLVLYNQNNLEAALSLFKRVAQRYPSTPEALQAIGSAKSIYIDQGQVDRYAEWVGTLGYVSVTDKELDNSSYESAEKQYLANNTTAAISLFNDYLFKFPNGLHLLKAHFYLAELYFNSSLFDNALPHLEYINAQPNNEFSETSLFKSAQILLDKKDENRALEVLKALEVSASFPQNQLYAQSNLMKLYFKNDDLNLAMSYAKEILDHPKIDDYIKSDAQVILARSAFKTGDMEVSRAAYQKLESLDSGILGAEATYYNAFFKHEEKAYQASNQTIQALITTYSSYRYFAAKGLILMAKNFHALNDDFQATYILENVRDNFNTYVELVEIAKQQLEQIKSEVSKSNASVETENKN
jgi:tetratricopeptide (TPR) repeat protein